MVYIYRLKMPPSSSHPLSLSRTFSHYFTRISSSRPVVLSIRSSVFFSVLEMEGMRSGPSISFDLAAVIFFQILLFPSNSIIRPNGGNKKRDRRVRPSVRGFSCDCIREIVIYVCRHCVAGISQPIPKEVREEQSRKLPFTPRSGKPSASGVCPFYLALSRAFVRANRTPQ